MVTVAYGAALQYDHECSLPQVNTSYSETRQALTSPSPAPDLSADALTTKATFSKSGLCQRSRLGVGDPACPSSAAYMSAQVEMTAYNWQSFSGQIAVSNSNPMANVIKEFTST